MAATLKEQLNEAMKAAMRAKDKDRLAVIRLILADCKRVEVDERTELTDERVLAVLDKMVKQRRDSARQFRDGGRTELAEKEEYEIGVIQEFLPQPLSEAEIDNLVDQAISAAGAESPKDMGKVMAQLKPQIQGRADMGAVSQKVKGKLGS